MDEVNKVKNFRHLGYRSELARRNLQQPPKSERGLSFSGQARLGPVNLRLLRGT